MKLKIRFSLLLGWIILVFGLFGWLGIAALNFSNDIYYSTIQQNKKLVTASAELSEEYNGLRRLVTRVLYEGTPDSELRDDITQSFTNTSSAITTYEILINATANTISYDTEYLKSLINNILQQKDAYKVAYDSMIVAIASNNNSEMKRLNEEIVTVGTDISDTIHSLTISVLGDLGIEADRVSHLNDLSKLSIVLIFVISAIIIMIILLRVSRAVMKPLETLKASALKIAEGDLTGRVRLGGKDEISDLSEGIGIMCDNFKSIIKDIDVVSKNLHAGDLSNAKIDEEKYSGDYKKFAETVNSAIGGILTENQEFIEAMNKFVKGNFDFEVTEKVGEKVEGEKALKWLQYALKEITTEVLDIVEAIKNGMLDKHIALEEFQGEWLTIGNGFVDLLSAIKEPIIETQLVFDEFSKGNFSYRMEKEYSGDFAKIQSTANSTAEAVGGYISEISEILTNMSQKNYDIVIQQEYLGDFAKIKLAVERIIKNLNILVRDIMASAEQVADGAKQISESSLNLADGANEQAEAVELLKNVTSDISEETKANVSNAEKANKLALQTKESAGTGSKRMNDMLSAMDSINKSSDSISNVIRVIDDIAFQTNILALNAAVEAARAGENGKGFAIVAEEVRSLANRSQEAAKETTELIEGSIESVAEGSEIADQTSKALISIVEQIEEISGIISDSEVSSKAQQKSIIEVTEGINKIAEVMQINTATSEESSAASEELASQAEVFFDTVSDFKLKKEFRINH